MKISVPINFSLCYLDIVNYFSRHTMNFLTFSMYFSKFIKKYVQNVSTTLGKVNWQNCLAKIHYCTAVHQTYINSYFSTHNEFHFRCIFQNSSRVKKYVENVSTTLGKVNCQAKIHYCTLHSYINIRRT